ncbi:MAG: hypothetical protein L3J52_03975 [Proteobacteria bacterium]|nr:hypothetical protein [Pseudomonadota bacterium]
MQLKSRFLFTVFFLLNLSVSFAESITKITPDDFIRINNIYEGLGENIVFTDINGFLWISEGTASTTRKMLNNQEPVQLAGNNALLKLGENFIFINLNDDNTLWKTNGYNFQKLSDVGVNPFEGLVIRNGKVIVKTMENNSLLITDGIQSHELSLGDLNSPVLKSVCLVDDNQYNIVARTNDSNTYKIFNYKNNQFMEIAQEILVSASGVHEYKLQYQNTCFYGYLQINENQYTQQKYLKILESAVSQSIEAEVEGTILTSWFDTFIFKDKLYFLSANNSFIGSLLYQFEDNSSLLMPVQSVNILGSVLRVLPTENYLYISYYPESFGIPSVIPLLLGIYDSNLESVAGSGSLAYSAVPQIYAISDENIMLTQASGDRLYFTENGIPTNSLRLFTVSVQQIVKSGQNVYVLGRDKNNYQKQSLYKISSQPSVSSLLTGLWVSPEWQSQGLSINTGKRSDGSIFLFTSFYMYKDGNPFWLAGVADIEAGQSSISINLKEFRGNSFIPGDIGEDFQETFFGQIHLNPTACNALTARIDYVDNEDDTYLDMSRIIDTNNESICFD